MKCDRIQELFSEEWAGTLAAGDRSRLESHLSECAPCREERESLNRLWQELGTIPAEEAGSAVRARFYAMLEGYRQGLGRARDLPPRRADSSGWLAPWFGRRAAFQFGLASLLIVAGFVAGYVLRSSRNGHEELVSLREEMHEMRQMVAISLQKQPSASERLKGVSWSSQVSHPEPEFLSTLVQTLNFDPSVDVRLAAVDALSRFAGESAVRQELVKSMPRQDSPLVKISLIDLLVQLHERQSIEVLKKLTDDATQDEQVRKRAHWGLQILS